MLSISVLICTRNRAGLLTACLNSIKNQSIKPAEVIVVDNASVDTTKLAVETFRKTLQIRYVYEPSIGLPYARNTSIQHARGDITAFIDDDCQADSRWVESIRKHFFTHHRSVGLVGKTTPYNSTRVYSLVEYAYYYRWVLQNVQNPDAEQLLSSGTFIDFKNAAFKRSFITNMRFSTDVPFGDVGDEDVELGNRLYVLNKNIYYDPAVRVSHRYSTTIQRLFVRNFWNGVANQMSLRGSINIKATPQRVSLFSWMSQANSFLSYQPAPFLKRMLFILLLILYPVSSKLGRLLALSISTLHLPMSIPKRS